MSKRTYYLHSYGCQMNLADSGILSAAMEKAGFTAVARPEEAGVIILNTCSVREKAEERALGRLSELAHLKKDGETYLCAVGCMAQRMGKDIIKRIPEIDFVLGTERLFELPDLIDRKNGQAVIDTSVQEDIAWAEFPPQPDNPYCAHVTITRGCDNYCAYCIVPYLRGPERHRKARAIISDVTNLVARGVLDVTLVGQNVNSYRDEQCGFPELLGKVATETDVKRIRFITSHPKDLSDDLIARFAEEPKVMGHIHLPLQSGSDSVLERMFRKYTFAHYQERVMRLRAARPDIAVTTDLLVGFPGETDEEFHDTLAAVDEIEFDAAFMFRYSERSGTFAAEKLKDNIPEEIKLRRLQELIRRQKEVSFKVNQREIGKIRQVLVDGASRRDENILKGKTEGNKTILFAGDKSLIGQIIPVVVRRADSWTLHGEIR